MWKATTPRPPSPPKPSPPPRSPLLLPWETAADPRPPSPERTSNRASPTRTTMASAVPARKLSNRRRRSRSSPACPRRTSRTATSSTASSGAGSSAWRTSASTATRASCSRAKVFPRGSSGPPSTSRTSAARLLSCATCRRAPASCHSAKPVRTTMRFTSSWSSARAASSSTGSSPAATTPSALLPLSLGRLWRSCSSATSTGLSTATWNRRISCLQTRRRIRRSRLLTSGFPYSSSQVRTVSEFGFPWCIGWVWFGMGRYSWVCTWLMRLLFGRLCWCFGCLWWCQGSVWMIYCINTHTRRKENKLNQTCLLGKLKLLETLNQRASIKSS